MRRPSEKNGFVRAYVQGSDKSFQFRIDEYTALLEAWKAGRAFFDGFDCYGDPLHVKLGEVIGIALARPASIAAFDEEDEAMKLAGGE